MRQTGMVKIRPSLSMVFDPGEGGEKRTVVVDDLALTDAAFPWLAKVCFWFANLFRSMAQWLQ